MACLSCLRCWAWPPMVAWGRLSMAHSASWHSLPVSLATALRQMGLVAAEPHPLGSNGVVVVPFPGQVAHLVRSYMLSDPPRLVSRRAVYP